ncbi:META domain-containing protein [Chryseobacterium arthrosphaerae]|uniref:Heat-shock protein n=1 Tax=Chryseobacterium arthrosphaerae TaxID=651561 RepID=A0A1B8ZEU4_9FLAO|nr:META domain-containing protein [Chryseobacterium arthrosphaerae]AYZ10801.1 META domain-containing protein [Chryseobacterium arthrosphaerae]OCA70139.1 heat-shock protein [Chryseobacterium arthrosphaerae]UEQ76035.1 META domain-containing protein [Chryseobacterium arthrosphaerae]
MKSLYYYLSALVIATFLVVSCKPQASAQKPTTDITGKTWKLTELYGKPINLKNPKNNPHFKLNMDGMRYEGHAGCNGFGGTFEIKPEIMRIKFNQGMSTMMACEDLEIENQFTKAVLAADNYSVNGNTLTLNKARMAPLAKFVLE